MKLQNGAIIGAGCGIAFAMVIGAGLGVITKVGPCAGAASGRSEWEFALSGMAIFGTVLSVPAGLIGILAGLLNAALDQQSSDPSAPPTVTNESQNAAYVGSCAHCGKHRFVCDCENPHCNSCNLRMKYVGADDENAYFECPSCGAEQEVAPGD